jgi:hypothetical protein
VFRNMTPKDLDAVLPRLQVLARSSPEDKFLLVCRLNGYALPKTQAEWEEKHKKRIGMLIFQLLCIRMVMMIIVMIITMTRDY